MTSLVINTTASVGPAISETATAKYVSGQIISQTVVLKAGAQFASLVGFSAFTLSVSGPVLLTATKGTNVTYIDVVVNQSTTIDDTVDLFQITNNGTATISAQFTYTVATVAPVAITGIVTSVNGVSGAVVLNASNLPGLKPVALSGSYNDLSGTPVLAAVATSGNYNDLINKYVLPVATASALGGVKQGLGVTIAADGTLSTNGSGVTPVAFTTITVTAAIGNQSVFTVPGGYPVGLINVFGFGSYLVPGLNYTANDGQTITVSSAIAAQVSIGVELTVQIFASFDIANAVQATTLVGAAGASLIGTSEGPTVQQTLDTLNSQLNKALTVQVVAATSAGQSVFPIPLGYPVNLIDVDLVGADLINGTDYSATDGQNIVLSSAVAALVQVGNNLKVSAFGSFNVANAVQTTTLGASGGAALVGYGAQTVKQALDTLTQATAPDAGTLLATDKFSLGRGAGPLTTPLSTLATAVTSAIATFTQTGTGAVARTVSNRLLDSISLLDFGADRTGATDSSVALNVAIAVIQTIAVTLNQTYPLPAIDVPGGHYALSQTINTYPWVKLRSSGSVLFDFATLPAASNGFVCRNEQTAIPKGSMNWGTHSPFLDGTGGSIMIKGPASSTGFGITMGNIDTNSGDVRDTGGCNVIVTGWSGALHFDPINLYLIKWKNCRFEQNTNYGIHVNPTSGNQINSGERMLFEDVTFSGSINALYQNCDGFDYNFVSCSFDFNGTPFLFGPHGRYSAVRLIGGHTEAFDGLFFDATTSGQYVNLIIEGHDILPTPWKTTVPCAPSRLLIDGNPVNHMRMTVSGLTLEYLVRPYLPNSASVGANVDVNGVSGVIYQSFFGPFQLLRSLARDYDFSLDSIGTTAPNMTAWYLDTTFSEVAVTDVSVQAAPTLAGSQALQFTGTSATTSIATVGTRDMIACAPGEVMFPGCDFYGGTATGTLNVRVFMRYYDSGGAFLSDSNTWFVYSMAAAYADPAVPNTGNPAQWFPTNYVEAIAPAKASFYRLYVTVSNFNGVVWVRNVRSCYTNDKTSAFGIQSGLIPNALTTQVASYFLNATYTVGPRDFVLYGDGTTVFNLPDVTTIPGRILIIKNVGSGTTTLNPFSAPQTIDNLTQVVLSNQEASLILQAGTTVWNTLSSQFNGPVRSTSSLGAPIAAYHLNATYTLLKTDFAVLGDGTTVFNLPPVGTVAGQIYAIKNIGVGSTTVNPNIPAEAIDGLTSLVMTTRNASILIQAGSSGWQILASQYIGLGTIAAQNANAVAITGGTVDGVTAGGTTPLTGVTINSNYALSFGTNAFVYGSAANTVEQYNGTNPQIWNIYNTRTNASNYERGTVQWSSNIMTVGTSQAGTGVARSVGMQIGGNLVWLFDTSQALRPAGANAAPNIGLSGNRILHLYQNGVQVNSATIKVIPTTGNTVTVAQTTSTQLCVPAGGLAALTVQFPTPLADGHEFTLVITQAITTLTLTPNTGATILGGSASTAGYSTTRWKYYAADTAWYLK